jgi:hypothetical protein
VQVIGFDKDLEAGASDEYVIGCNLDLFIGGGRGDPHAFLSILPKSRLKDARNGLLEIVKKCQGSGPHEYQPRREDLA